MKLKTAMLLSLAASSTVSFAEIKQSLGVDQRVDYKSLTKYGPWDDRNYNLTKEDLAIIPAKDQYLANVPVFFKIEKRKEIPNLGEFYPRSTLQHFQMDHGGLIIDGIWYKEGLGLGYHPDPPTGKVGGIEVKQVVRAADNEVSLENGVFGNEVTIECNPTNKNNCVAGANTSSGQTMYYSSDAGVTWTKSQTNPDGSCCDPTVDWSADGSIVYQADLRRSGGIGVRWSRSLDQGHTWEPMKSITTTYGDKEFIHVDRSSSSPHKDNLYITWHEGNVMQFARSTDMGQTMSTPISFSSEEKGIGSDITTDSAGNVYYFYPSVDGGGIRLLKSTDGGTTFATGTQVAAIRGRYIFPIPAMESRQAFIYVSADVDSNDNIYVAFTDETAGSVGGGTGSAANNHAEIRIFKSTDAGATWSELPNPHSTADSSTVDRFHPWLKVGENNTIHIGFYDTRHSTGRSGVDFYYNASTNGGTSWEFPNGQRYTTETSTNINNAQEWGDYNGLSVVLDKIAMTWTDNRASASQAAMVGTSQNQFGDCPVGYSQFDIVSYTFDADDLIFKNGFEADVPSKVSVTQGWTVAADVGAENWSLQPVGESGSTAFQADDLGALNDTSLYSPEIALPTGVGPLTLRFWNTQKLEASPGGCFDGAVLEISSDGGNTYMPITNAQIINDDYKGPISSSYSNPLSGRNAWCGDPMAAKVFSVDVDSFAGSNVKFRFRVASDIDTGRPEGWAIDNVKVTGCQAP